MAAELNIAVSAQGTEVTTNAGTISDAAEGGQLVEATALAVRQLDRVAAERFKKRTLAVSTDKDQQILFVSVGRRGINYVHANSGVIEQLQDVLSLLHNAAISFFTGKPKLVNLTLKEFGDPDVWIPTEIDGFDEAPRKVSVRTVALPRDRWVDPPSWFIAGCKILFPEADWGSTMSTVQLMQCIFTEDAPLIPLTVRPFRVGKVGDAELAVMLFGSRYASFLDHWGWLTYMKPVRVPAPDLPQSSAEWTVNRKKNHRDTIRFEDTGEDRLISEPYVLREQDTMILAEVCRTVAWTWSIRGLSGHAPSDTIRIEIYPKDQRER